MIAFQFLLTQIRSVFQSAPKPKAEIKPEPPKHEPKAFPDPFFVGEVERKHWPAFMSNCEDVKGVYIGACYYKQGKKWKRSFGSAHAHVKTGWICFQSMKKWNSRLIQLHETAHVSAQRSHTLNWAKEYVKLANGKPNWLTTKWLQNKYGFKTKKKATKKDQGNAQ